jgi:hypothetical protein
MSPMEEGSVSGALVRGDGRKPSEQGSLIYLACLKYLLVITGSWVDSQTQKVT